MSLIQRDEWDLNQSNSSLVSTETESRREQVTACEYTVQHHSEMSFVAYSNGVSNSSNYQESTIATSNFGSSSQNTAGNFNLRSSSYILKDEKHWVEIQINTFTNWLNEQLREYGEEVSDLSTAFEDGLKLIHVVEKFSTKKVGRYNKKPKLYAQKLENVKAALSVVEEDGIQLVNIGSDDIVNGNLKLILGLIWRLILHYQISSSGSTSGKQLLLIWLRNALPDLEIKNVTSDWNNGIALSGLVEFCKPGLKPDYKRLNPDERLSNVTTAMGLAEQRLRIPKILSPEFFVNPYVDELSMMTYLSQFSRPGSPGEARTMEIVNEALPKGQKVSNFNEDWVDGKVLCHFVESQVPGTIPNYKNISELSPYERARLALEKAEEKLGIKKIITPEEVVDNVDELPLMAYVLQFRNAPSLQSQAHVFTAEGNGLRRATQGKTVDFNVHGRKGIGFNNLKVDVTGPSSNQKVDVEKRLMGDGSMRYMYTPGESGMYTISIKHLGKHVPNSPFIIKANEDVGDITVSGSGLRSANVMRSADFIVDPKGPTSAVIRAIAEGPTRTVPVVMDVLPNGSYKAKFVATEVGDHRITVMAGNRSLPGCPFICKVGDPSKCVLRTQDATSSPSPGKNVHYTVDTSQAGPGELVINCAGPEGSIPVNVQSDNRGHYDVRFTPQQTGDYRTSVTFNGDHIPSSPYNLYVADSTKIVAHGKGLYQVCTRETSEFFITVKGAGQGNLEVRGEGPHGRFPVEIKQSPSDHDKFIASYTLFDAGDYRIYVNYAGQPVPGSPFLVKVADPTKVRIDSTNPNFLGKKFPVKREIEVPIQVPHSAGEGQLEASVTGPDLETVPANVIKGTGNEHLIRFVPRKQGSYKIDVKYGGKAVQNSPFRLRVTDPDSVRVKLRELESNSEGFYANKQMSIPIESVEDATDISCTVKGPGGERVESRLSRESEKLHHVNFTPYRPGKYTVDVLSNGESVQNSPFIITVMDEPPVQLNFKTLEKQSSTKYRVRHELDVPMEIPKNVGEITASVTDPDQRYVSSTFHQEGDGLHHLRFTPNKPGPYQIDILCRGKSVEGCPFIMSVVDPASTLVRMRQQNQSTETRFLVRRELNIALHCPDEDFDLSCTVEGPDDEFVQSSMGKEGDGLHHVKFVPYRPGTYKVHVRYGGEPVESSPFLIRAGDPENKIRLVQAQNLQAALTKKEINSEVDLALEIPFQIDKRDITTTILGPGDKKISSQLQRDREGKYHVKFVPIKPGQHKIFVRYGGELVEGAPYIINVADKVDASKVRIESTNPKLLGKTFPVRHEIEVPIHVPLSAGEAQLEASVTGPDLQTVPANVIKDTVDNYLVRFVPRKQGLYKIDVKYGGTPVQNSPFRLRTTDPTSVRVNVRELESASEGFFVNKQVSIPVETDGETMDISCTIKGPGGERLKPKLIRESEKLHHLRFTPYHPGKYTVDVLSNEESVQNSPFVITVMDEPPVQLNFKTLEKQSSAKYRVRQELDVPMEIPNKVGEVTARVIDPDQRYVSSTFHQEADGLHHLRFTPNKPGPYQIDILCRGKSVEGCPFIMSVVDPASTLVRMRQPNQSAETRYLVRRELDIALHCPDEDFDLSCTVEGPDDEFVQSSMGKEGDGLHHVKFVPYRPGTYKIHVRYGGEAVESSPFLIRVGDTENKIRLAHAQNVQAAQTEKVIKKEVDLALETPIQIDERDVTASVLGPGDEEIASELEKDKEGKYHVKFVPFRPGQYKIFVRYGGELVEGAPYIVNVGDKPVPTHMRCLVGIDKLDEQNYYTNRELDFPVEVPEGENGSLTAKITGPDNSPVDEIVTKDHVGSSTYHIRFIPRKPGKYQMEVLYSGIPVKDSPFYIVARDQIPGAKKCEAKGRGLIGGKVNERCEFKVDTSQAGGGNIQAWLSGVKYNANVDVELVGDNTYVCHYITPVPGAYVLTIRYDGVDIPGSPFKVAIQASGDASRCTVEGEALSHGTGAFVGKPMGISISSRDAGPGQLHVRCEGPTRDCDVTVFDNRDSTYHVQILPTEVGNHLVYVEWGGSSVQGSPFLVRVGFPPDPTKVTAVGPGLENGLLKTFKGSFLVDTKGAGPGTLKVRIHGPKGAFKVEMYRDTTKERSIGVRYNPTEVGRYVINIKWADQHIPGSPFDVTLVKSKEELDSLNDLKDNVVTQQNGLH